MYTRQGIRVDLKGISARSLWRCEDGESRLKFEQGVGNNIPFSRSAFENVQGSPDEGCHLFRMEQGRGDTMGKKELYASLSSAVSRFENCRGVWIALIVEVTTVGASESMEMTKISPERSKRAVGHRPLQRVC